jgi:superfamily II DNA or RNA helicase
MTTVKFTPFPYQPAMIDWCLTRHSSALFVSAGKGKTVCTLSILTSLFSRGEIKGVLIVAPLRVCSITWVTQVQKWEHSCHLKVAQLRSKEGMQAWEDQSADIYLINSEQLISKSEFLFKRKSLPVDCIVIDEISLAKNPKSKRFAKLKNVLPLFKYRIGLTGTPVPNDYLDLYGQIRLLDDGKRLGKTYFEYRRKLFYQADYMGYTYKLLPNAKEKIDEILSDLCLVIQGDGSDLPSSSVIDILVNMPRDAQKVYNELEKELLVEVASTEIVALTAATLCGKLRQVLGGAVYDEDKNVIFVHDAKVEALKKIRERHKLEPMLILTSFKHESKRILATIEGSEMFDERRMDDWMNGKIHTWVADPRSLSHGIDGLQTAGRIAVWYSLTYSNETYMQTNARLIRIGQAASTIIYRIICPNTLDDAIAETLRDKTNTQSGLLSALTALQKIRQIK